MNPRFLPLEKRGLPWSKKEHKAWEKRRKKSHEEVAKTSVGETMGKAGTSVKEGIVSGLKGINEIETQMMGRSRNTVSETLKVTGSVVGETLAVTKEVLQGAVKAAEEVGTGLGFTMKSVAKGIVMGVSDVGGDVWVRQSR